MRCSIAKKIRELAAFVELHNIAGQIEKQWNSSIRHTNPVQHFIENARDTINRWMTESSGILRNRIIKVIEEVTGNRITWKKNELVPIS